jgi:hypothetical protein
MANNITIKRENTVNIQLKISPITLVPSDIIYFTVKPYFDDDQQDSTAVIKEQLTGQTGSTAQIKLAASKTNIEPGSYVYDIKLARSNGDQTTAVIGKCKVIDVVTLRGA